MILTNCSFEACGRPARAKGLCGSHWRQEHAGKPLRALLPPGQHEVPRPVRFDGETAFIPLSKEKWAVVDLVDADLGAFSWYAVKGPVTWYACRRLPSPSRATQYLHAVIAERAGIAREGMETDHRDGFGLNCRRSNLRPATRAQNAQNCGTRKDNKSGHKGVCWNRAKGKWDAAIHCEGTKYRLGSFLDKADAIRAYDEAAARLHGEFARTE